ncbi:PE family protein [Nocardia sp. NPDC019395]|uniref:PE family protein n=1 Tax=Nocardia sp. NPDC019395 TaxID=3154686 RepID=UPI0033D249E3
MHFDPIQAHRSSTDLDALAGRLEDVLKVNSPALAVAPVALDEVSIRAADTLTGIASSYDDAAARGVHEIRKLAAALRSQSDQVLRMDGDNASGFPAGN